MGANERKMKAANQMVGRLKKLHKNVQCIVSFQLIRRLQSELFEFNHPYREKC